MIISTNKKTHCCVFFSGGDEGDRTPYLLNAIQALSQVSYTPMCEILSDFKGELHFIGNRRPCQEHLLLLSGGKSGHRTAFGGAGFAIPCCPNIRYNQDNK
jgi:hypothetical protein